MFPQLNKIVIQKIEKKFQTGLISGMLFDPGSKKQAQEAFLLKKKSERLSSINFSQ